MLHCIQMCSQSIKEKKQHIQQCEQAEQIISQHIKRFQQALHIYSADERETITDATTFAVQGHQHQERETGEPYVTHPIFIAEFLAKMHLDHESIVAALLHDLVEDTDITIQGIRQQFGEVVESLVAGLTNMTSPTPYNKNKSDIENIRQMLFASVHDVRIIIIKLADKLHNLSTMSCKSIERQKSTAQEVLDIYAPLAELLGIRTIQRKLEDGAFAILDPKEHEKICKKLPGYEAEAEKLFASVGKQIREKAAAKNFAFLLETRLKGIYSIAQKERQHEPHQIHDHFGIRIICDDDDSCYRLLGIVHAIWMPLAGRFKDYIAKPKTNGYQSLHTTVMGANKSIEFQIRSEAMHHIAEYGVAAHWNYKHNEPSPVEHDIQMKLQQIQNFQHYELLDGMKREILPDSIHVFTPKGKKITLPEGATALDFAYHIHTDIGHHAASARANGERIPLHKPLKDTCTVEIIIDKQIQPNLKCLQQCQTERARTKIRNWLNHHERKNLFIDKQIVAKTSSHTSNFQNTHILFARCCEPTFGDPITAYTAPSRGIIVHRKTCKNLRKVPEFEKREIQVEWEQTASLSHFQVVAHFALRQSHILQKIDSAAWEHNIILNNIEIQRLDDSIQVVLSFSSKTETEAYQFTSKLRAIPSTIAKLYKKSV